MNKLTYLIALAILLTYSCKNGQEKTSNSDSALAAAIQNTDSVQMPLTLEKYPQDSMALPGRILNESVYHNDEVDTAIVAGNWWGLFKGSEYYIAPTKLAVAQVKDEIIDGANEKTGWEIKDDNSDTTILLIKNIATLKQGKLTAMTLPEAFEDHIKPGKPFRFMYGNKAYTLFAKAAEGKNGELQNYQLLVMAEKNGQSITQVLVSQPSLDDAIPSVLFCGDLDGDGIPDFIINSTYHYNVYQPTLYLSGNAGEGKLYQLVAIHHAVGC